MNIYIKMNEKETDQEGLALTTNISSNTVKPYDTDNEEWNVIRSYVESFYNIETKSYTDIKTQ